MNDSKWITQEIKELDLYEAGLDDPYRTLLTMPIGIRLPVEGQDPPATWVSGSEETNYLAEVIGKKARHLLYVLENYTNFPAARALAEKAMADHDLYVIRAVYRRFGEAVVARLPSLRTALRRILADIT